MKRRLLTTLIVMLSICSSALAAIKASGNCGKNGSDVTWTLTDDGKLTIKGNGKMADYGYPYESIDDIPWTSYRSIIKTLVIEPGVTNIGYYAFYQCSALSSVSISNSVVNIGENAFSNCFSLTSINIPFSVIVIERYAFDHCESLTSIVIPNGVKKIEDMAFYYCKSLSSITIPNSVTSIGYYSFYACKRPNSVVNVALTPQKIYYDSFGENYGTLHVLPGCKAAYEKADYWRNFTIVEDAVDNTRGAVVDSGTCGTNMKWEFTEDGTLTIQGNGSMNSTPWSSHKNDIKMVSISDGVTSIVKSAFSGYSFLSSITIPSSVTSIGNNAFYGCYMINSNIKNNSSFDLTKYGLTICDTEMSDGLLIKDNVAVYCRKNAIYVIIPSSVTSIGSAFSGCSSLSSVVIPSSVTSIGGSAFERCSSLSSVVIPSSVTSIGDYAFQKCSSLSSVVIPSSVTSIGRYAFSECSSLSSVVIPSSVTSIGDYTFEYCSSLSSVTIKEGVTSIGDKAFRYCTSLSSVVIPSSVTSIGSSAFNGCYMASSNIKNSSGYDLTKYGLTICDIEQTDGLLLKNNVAVFCRKNATSVVIPSSVTSIGDYAFSGCSSLVVLELCCPCPNGLSGISNVKHVIVPEEHYSDYRNEITSSTNHLYPASKLTFKETPTLKVFKNAMASVNKDELTSITFACDNVDDYLDVATIKSGLNPNCIIYVPKGAGITGDNVVEIEPAKGLSCDKLVLTDGYPFRAPEMNVGEVQYVHSPSVWANGKSGWEAICLPFSPSSVKASTSGYLSPIVLGGSGNFWLRKYVGSSNTSVFFTSTSDGVMEANTPYLMAFPGNAFGNNSLEGQKIVFSASDVEISALADPDLIKKNAFLFKSTYNTTPDASAGYELNVEGSSFVQVPQVGTHPFRAYFVNEDEAASSVKALKIDFGSFDEETGIFEVEEATDMRMNDDACYDLSGRRVSKNSTHKGIYIVNGKKVVR